MYLAFKSYKVDKAIISVIYNSDELIQLIELEQSRVKVSFSTCVTFSREPMKEEEFKHPGLAPWTWNPHDPNYSYLCVILM